MSQGELGASSTTKVKRQRKVHKKSRSGCINCRFRRVKCDEGKPSCQKCRSYMVSCNYSSCMEDLSVASERINPGIIVSRSQARERSSESTTPSPYSGVLLQVSFDKNHDVILRFQRRTALTIGDESTTQRYAEHVPRLAIEHDYLFHTVFATTLLHDRALAGDVKQTDAEAYHLGHAAALFNKQLSSPSSEQHCDALWATAIYLCAMSVFIIDTHNPKEAWPLSKVKTNNLEWLEFQAGLRVMWNITKVNRSGGVFAQVGKSLKMNCVYPRTPQSGIDGLPKKLVDLCGLAQDSTPDNDPYHAAVRHLTWLLPTRGDHKHMLDFMVFAGGLSNEFRVLLQRKEPRALLLMAIWYSKLFNSSWWMAPRAAVECRAISLYLAVHGLLDDETFRATLALVSRACWDKTFDIGLAILHDGAENIQPMCKTVSNTEKSAPSSMLVDMFWMQ